MSNYNLTKMATQIYFPGNIAQVDDVGLPSILVYIPAFKNSDVLNGGDDSTHPAFIVNGKEVPGFYYSKYQNVVHSGRAYSLPAEDPQTSVNFDISRELCEAKGAGWHLSTAAEWAAIALWCKKNGFLPYGNNDYGKDSRENKYTAIQSSTEISRVATGSGPLTWSHDKTMSGIWDLNGNAWEWQSGIRLVWGELQILANNDAADPDNPQNATSTCWKAIKAADGSLVEPECKTTDATAKLSGNTVRVDYVSGIMSYCVSITNQSTEPRSSLFSAINCTGSISDAAKVLLRSLALLPDSETVSADYENDRMYLTNGVNERYMYRGGRCGSGGEAGIFSLSVSTRTAANGNTGFRAAYIPEIAKEG